jgi:hypothetical protein
VNYLALIQTNKPRKKKGAVMKLRIRIHRAAVILAILITAPASVSADAVGDWNAIAVQATIDAGTMGPAGRAGPSGAIDIAMVHAAIYDAV